MNMRTIFAAGIAASLFAMPVFAHHSFAMFDAEKESTLEGTIKDFLWTNPHSWILVMIPNAQGVEEEWAIELGSPGNLSRRGWQPDTLTPGMKVTAIVHPLRDGTNGGALMALTLPDGNVLDQDP